MSGPGKRVGDLILIGGCLLLAALLFLPMLLNREAGAGVVVAVDGREVARYSLAQSAVYELNGGTNTLVIENGEAWLSHADCPDHLCVKQGKIRAAGQVITCLPNKLTVTVYGGEDSGVDLIS